MFTAPNIYSTNDSVFGSILRYNQRLDASLLLFYISGIYQNYLFPTVTAKLCEALFPFEHGFAADTLSRFSLKEQTWATPPVANTLTTNG